MLVKRGKSLTFKEVYCQRICVTKISLAIYRQEHIDFTFAFELCSECYSCYSLVLHLCGHHGDLVKLDIKVIIIVKNFPLMSMNKWDPNVSLMMLKKSL